MIKKGPQSTVYLRRDEKKYDQIRRQELLVN